MTPPKPSALAKPTLDTPYHIDYDWWPTSGEDLRVVLLRHVPPEFHDMVAAEPADRQIDYIDPRTGRVSRVDPLHFALKVAAEDPAFINREISVIDCVLRVLLMNDNRPVTPRELADLTGYDGQQILRLLSGARVYYGIRPFIT